MKNQEISSIFYDIADILEMQNVAWKPRAYRQAAQSIDSLKKDIEEIYQKEGLEGLNRIPNIGGALAKKMEEYIKKGKIGEYEKLLNSIPRHIRNLMKIPGLGAKRIQKLHEALKITSIKQLEKAAKQHKIAKLPGFGEKSEQEILEAIELSRTSKDKFTLKEAEEAANKIINKLKKLKEVKQISSAGSVKRKRAFVRDLDFLASSNSPEKVINAFTSMKDVKKILGKGSTKAIIILKSGIQCDLRVIKPESWGAASLYFIGNKNYNINMRKIAIKKGYKLNEYGLFDKSSGKMLPSSREKEITDKLGMKWLKPEDREM